MPYSDNELMEKALYMVDKNCKVKYTDEIKRKIFPMWVNGIITQLTSIPEDMGLRNGFTITRRCRRCKNLHWRAEQEMGRYFAKDKADIEFVL